MSETAAKPCLAMRGVEWASVTPESPGAWAHLDQGITGTVQATGEYDSVRLMGTLFEGDAAEVEIATLTPAKPFDEFVMMARLRPVVEGRTATIRVYAPKG